MVQALDYTMIVKVQHVIVEVVFKNKNKNIDCFYFKNKEFCVYFTGIFASHLYLMVMYDDQTTQEPLILKDFDETND